MVMNDARDKLYSRHPWIRQYTGHMGLMLSHIQHYEGAAFYLDIDSLSMILNPYNDLRWAGNEAAHIASNAEKSAAIMSDDLPTWTREHLRNIYIYAYERLPLQIS